MSEGDLNFKKLHQAVNLREDWSGFLLFIISNFPFFLSLRVFLETSVYELCMIQRKCSWITARIIFYLGETNSDFFQCHDH